MTPTDEALDAVQAYLNSKREKRMKTHQVRRKNKLTDAVHQALDLLDDWEIAKWPHGTPDNPPDDLPTADALALRVARLLREGIA